MFNRQTKNKSECHKQHTILTNSYFQNQNFEMHRTSKSNWDIFIADCWTYGYFPRVFKTQLNVLQTSIYDTFCYTFVFNSFVNRWYLYSQGWISVQGIYNSVNNNNLVKITSNNINQITKESKSRKQSFSTFMLSIDGM